MFKCRHSVTASPGQADTFMQLAGVVWEFPHETAHIKIFFVSNLVIISVKRCCCWVFPNISFFFFNMLSTTRQYFTSIISKRRGAFLHLIP